jgi:methyl-accepting chemotaxis protein/methyl-accepting chemotaxis protein-1 (serine sensor receptor)
MAFEEVTKQMSSSTFSKKLFLGIGSLVALTLFLGVTVLFSFSSISAGVRTIVHTNAQREAMAAAISTETAEMLAANRSILFRGYMHDLASVQQDNQSFEATASQLQQDLNTIEPLLTQPESQQEVRNLRETLEPILEANRQVFQAAMAGDMSQAVAIYTSDIRPTQLRQTDAAAVLLKDQEAAFLTEGSGIEGTILGNRSATILLLIMDCVGAVLVAFSVRKINALLRSSVAELAESSLQIAAAASQMAAGSQSLAQGASQQAATIEETSSAATEINSMAQRAAENSRTTAEMVNASEVTFADANRSLGEMVAAMVGIVESSQQISTIIKVIDEIAFQTNLLALNAAIEAAHAGEAGLGFAVVADEVRNLAQRSAQAAKNTTTLIEDSIAKAGGGRVKVDQVGSSLRSITAEFVKIKDLIAEIQQGSIEQSRGVDQISKAITQMEQMTQHTAANSQEGAASSAELNTQAESLQNVVDRLSIMVDGEVGGGSTRFQALTPVLQS